MYRGISPGRMLRVNFPLTLFFFNNSPERKLTNQSIDKHAHFHGRSRPRGRNARRDPSETSETRRWSQTVFPTIGCN